MEAARVPQKLRLHPRARDSHRTLMGGERQGAVRVLQNKPWEPRRYLEDGFVGYDSPS